MPNNKRQNVLTPELIKLHEQACKEFLDYYLDPETSYKVFTADYHKKRGKCCESACRHCPYRIVLTEKS